MKEPQKFVTDVAIVGAGPAGLMAAIAAAEAGTGKAAGGAAGGSAGGRRVLVCEQLDRPGVKLLASGGGRCNLTNNVGAAAVMAGFGRQGRFMQPALAALDSEGLRQFLRQLGVATICPDGLRVYPASNSAVTVQSALWRRCRDLGVQLLFRSRVTGLRFEGEGSPSPKGGAAGPRRLAGLATQGGDIDARCVILAAGGCSYPELGGTGGGYALARQGGHTIVQPVPALVPLLTREKWVRSCAGLSFSSATVRIDLPGQARAGLRGDVLLTHSGVSGPAVLDISGDVAELLLHRPAVPLRLDLSPGTTAAQWRARFDEWGHREGARMVHNLLGQFFPDRLANALCSLADVDGRSRAAVLGRRGREALADLLTGLPLTAVGTEGFARAMITRGGVSLKEIDPQTLVSRKLDGLFLAGEVVDLDGPSGGYNIQWAMSSGRLAGLSAGPGI